MSADLFNLLKIVEDPRLSDLVLEQISVSCAKCGLEWQDDKRTTIAVMGNIRVDQLIWQVSALCKRKGMVDDPCAAAVV